MQELNYIRCGDYYISDIRLPEEPDLLVIGGVCTEIILKSIIQSASTIFVSVVNCGPIWLI